VEPMLEAFTVYANETIALIMTPLIMLFILMFYHETGMPKNYGIRYTDLTYYILFSAVIIPFQCAIDVLLMNVLELFHTWPIFDYIEFCTHRFETRTAHWKMDEIELDETLDPPLQRLDQMCFSQQYYFIVTTNSFAIIIFYMAITMMIRAGYNMFGDPLFPMIALFVVFTGVCLRRVFIYFFKLLKIWRTTAPPQIDFAIDEKDETYDPLAHLKSPAVRTKFLEKNQHWLLENLHKLITPEALELHRPYLMYQYENLMRMQQAGRFDNPYGVSSDESIDMEARFKEVELTKKQERIMKWWLLHVRRSMRMKRLVDGIINANLEHECSKCGTDANLIVEMLVPLEDIVTSFDKKIAMNLDGIRDKHPVIAWRQHFKECQVFQTRCNACIAKFGFDKTGLQRADGLVISDDSGDEADFMDTWFAQQEVDLADRSRQVILTWLWKARDTIRLRRGRPEVPTLNLPGVSGSGSSSGSASGSASGSGSGSDSGSVSSGSSRTKSD